jgi:hypothetical protein
MDTVIVTIDIKGSSRPQSFADYSVVKYFVYSSHGIISSMCWKYHNFFLQLSDDERRDSRYCSHTDASSQFGEKISGQ